VVYSRITPASGGTATYPTKYQTDLGWAYIVQAQEIKTIDEALRLAKRIYGVARLPRRTVTFTTIENVLELDTVTIINRALRGPSDTGLVLPVVSAVQGKLNGSDVVFVTAGKRKKTAQDILSGPTVDLLNMRTAGIARTRGGLFSFSDPLVPRGSTINNLARGKNGASLLGLTDQDVLMHHRSPVNQSGVMRNGMPVDTTHDYNFYSAPIDWATLITADDGRPDPETAVIPKPQVFYTDAAGNIKEWNDATSGVNHPQHHVFEFMEDSWQSVIFPDIAVLSSMVLLTEYQEDGTRVADFDGTTTHGTFSAITLKLKRKDPATGDMIDVDPPVAKDHPFIVPFGYPVQFWAAGIPAGNRITAYLGERDPDPRLFANQPAVGP
jgi:hypothetical protein